MYKLNNMVYIGSSFLITHEKPTWLKYAPGLKAAIVTNF